MKTTKPKQPRNYHAINAQFRSSSGAMRDQRKHADKYACRGEVETEERSTKMNPNMAWQKVKIAASNYHAWLESYDHDNEDDIHRLATLEDIWQAACIIYAKCIEED